MKTYLLFILIGNNLFIPHCLGLLPFSWLPIFLSSLISSAESCPITIFPKLIFIFTLQAYNIFPLVLRKLITNVSLFIPKNKTELEFKSEIKETIELALSHHEKQLETKQKIEITKSSSIDEYLYNVSYNDTKKKIEQSKMLINSLNQKNFDHNSFLIKPSKPVPVSQYFSFLCSLL